MGMFVGGIDIAAQGMNNEFKIIILEKVVEKMLEKNPGIVTQEDIEKIRQEALKLLQSKYPQAGINLSGEQK